MACPKSFSSIISLSMIDIHHDPETFVRFILGMSSLNASDLGFDPRIYWRLKQQYFKPDLESDVEYRISRLNSKSLMRGRGTACYRVDHEGEKFFLKLYWHPVEKVPEWEFLLKAQEADIKGVAKVELYGEYVCISDLRCVPLVSTVGCDINDRVYTFIMQPMYGGTLTLKEFWKSYPEEQFLLAYRDTLAASMELLQIGIIHGDVNPFNILYNPGGLPGSRGILIDFDMALYIDEGQARDTVEPIIRVEAFRSIKVQEGHRYCHFDDIESFLYTYFRVCVCKPAEDDYVEFFTQDVIVDWKNSDHAMLKSFKKRLFGADNGHALRCLYGRDLSRPVLDLFIDLQRFFERQISRSLRKIDEERLGYNREEQSRPCLRVSDRLRAKMAERLDKLYERMPETYIKSLDAEGCNKWFTLLAKRHYYELLYYVDHAVATLRRTSSDAQTEITSQASEPSAPCGDRNYPKLSESKNAALQAASGNGLNVITSITNTPESNVKRTRSASDSISCNGREAKKAKEAVYYRIM
ncbi:hypothetical protein NEOLEDRAFT_978633 [Neolentinus lepideus HHB14362 ss-1]|uniref:Fungal-type protein kinase domain-containing protein n=1 Tax=Neolentinus lepideus HHB14362 ss-1 TaxID=1314782 RepID=A0A165N8R3_9AGAM|nr:hypothetical protein NEOLEDRAFT_978633 [Neolentinus lepideus HHB14362 ss-1]